MGIAALLDEIKCENPMARLRKVVPNNAGGGGGGAAKGAGEAAAKEKKNEPKQSHVNIVFFLEKIR